MFTPDADGEGEEDAAVVLDEEGGPVPATRLHLLTEQIIYYTTHSDVRFSVKVSNHYFYFF